MQVKNTTTFMNEGRFYFKDSILLQHLIEVCLPNRILFLLKVEHKDPRNKCRELVNFLNVMAIHRFIISFHISYYPLFGNCC